MTAARPRRLHGERGHADSKGRLRTQEASIKDDHLSRVLGKVENPLPRQNACGFLAEQGFFGGRYLCSSSLRWPFAAKLADKIVDSVEMKARKTTARWLEGRPAEHGGLGTWTLKEATGPTPMWGGAHDARCFFFATD